MNQSVAGRCLCGAVRFRLNGVLRGVVVCHCGMCRRWHGHVGAYTRVAKSEMEIEDDGGLAWFRASTIARRGFCRRCGSSLFWERDGSDQMSVVAGSLEAPTGLATTLQIFAEDAGDYYALDERIPVRPPASAGG
ncbi:MAG: GFA family protein [Alphaproteobacteria bacterium]|nr:GFA family protein [Alphaproteobacteria bacterium]